MRLRSLREEMSASAMCECRRDVKFYGQRLDCDILYFPKMACMLSSQWQSDKSQITFLTALKTLILFPLNGEVHVSSPCTGQTFGLPQLIEYGGNDAK